MGRCRTTWLLRATRASPSIRIEAQDLERIGIRATLDWGHRLSSWIPSCAQRHRTPLRCLFSCRLPHSEASRCLMPLRSPRSNPPTSHNGWTRSTGQPSLPNWTTMDVHACRACCQRTNAMRLRRGIRMTGFTDRASSWRDMASGAANTSISPIRCLRSLPSCVQRSIRTSRRSQIAGTRRSASTPGIPTTMRASSIVATRRDRHGRPR